jgi:hypothetical protein
MIKTSVPLRTYYEAVASDPGGGISSGDIESRFKQIGIGEGFTGPIVRATAARAVMAALGDVRKGRITWDTLVKGTLNLVPQDLLASDRSLNKAAACSRLGTIAGTSQGAAGRKQLTDYIQSMLAANPLMRPLASVIAEPSARVLLDMMGTDPNRGQLTCEKVEAFVDEVNAARRA